MATKKLRKCHAFRRYERIEGVFHGFFQVTDSDGTLTVIALIEKADGSITDVYANDVVFDD